MKTDKPTILIILDGWGIAPPGHGNAITEANTPNYDRFVQSYQTLALQASAQSVGLAWGEMGNSEVGHLSIGSGKILLQSMPKITQAINDRSFFQNKALLQAAEHSKKHSSAFHIMGLLSNGGVHSYDYHAYSLLEFAKQQGITKVYLHLFLDGRDSPQQSAKEFLSMLDDMMESTGVGELVTLAGRFYAMDRNRNWDRTEKAYKAMVWGQVDRHFASWAEALDASYANQVFDENFAPIVIGDGNEGFVQENDSVIFFNFRADRARQITRAFVKPDFHEFKRQTFENLFFVSMVNYDISVPVSAVAFDRESITNPLAKVISDHGLRQLHVAETEKYAHVTYFLNGHQQDPFPGEDWQLVPSKKVESYVDAPDMSSREITDRVLKGMESDYDFIVVNYAAPDMVGHTGDLAATIKAVQVVDECLGQIVDQAGIAGYTVFITADHGNAEELIKPRSGQVDKEHSTAPVPFIAIGEDFEVLDASIKLEELTPAGVLADVAPTVLSHMGIFDNTDMNGLPLLG